MVLDKMKSKNSDLVEELKMLKEEKKRMLDMSAKEFQALQADNSRLQNKVFMCFFKFLFQKYSKERLNTFDRV